MSGAVTGESGSLSMNDNKSQTPNHAVLVDSSQDADRRYVIKPEDNDLFVLTGRQVILACQLGISVQLWLKELQAMEEAVRDWCSSRAGRVSGCFLVPRGDKLVLYITPISSQYDFDLADEMTDLSMTLAREYRIGFVDLYQIPGGETQRFFNPKSARQLYGQPSTASCPVEA